MKYEPRALFHTGDLISGSRSDWSLFNEITSELRAKAEFYPAIGNHEWYSDLKNFYDNFELPGNKQWYSVERLGIHFVILNSSADIDADSPQFKWLESDLQKVSRDISFKIAILHHPPITSGFVPVRIRKAWMESALPLFEKYGVDIVFAGHIHAYERCLYKNIYYIATGGGGAPIHDRIRRCPFSEKYIMAHHFCLLYVEDKKLFVDVLDKGLKLRRPILHIQ